MADKSQPFDQHSSTDTDSDNMSKLSHFRQLRNTFSTSLKEFASSDASFRILRTVRSGITTGNSGSNATSDTPHQTDSLYVLDSSFNPPSKAHLEIAASAILDDNSSSRQPGRGDGSKNTNSSSRVLLLLATQNADKAPKPAPFEDRLVMMTLMAEQLRERVANDLKNLRQQNSTDSSSNTTSTADSNDPGDDRVPEVDIGVTKFPYFMDKARSIDESGTYISAPSPSGSDDTTTSSQTGFQQVHLTGYDTFIRIFDAKYYKPDNLAVLEPFLSRHRLRVLHRITDSDSNPNVEQEINDTGKEGQKEYLERIRRGEREDEGAKREWADKVEFVDLGDKVQGVSSTQARTCVKDGKMERDELGKFVVENVRLYMVEMGLYGESGSGGKL